MSEVFCSKCNKNIAENGKYCESCKERGREYTRRMRQKRKRKGICIVCGTNRAMRGVSYCSECSIECVESVLNRRTERELDGMCIFCGEKPKSDGNKSCDECADKINERYHSKDKCDTKSSE